ncbi:unnamed protein product, partial [Polarella glacialis]
VPVNSAACHERTGSQGSEEECDELDLDHSFLGNLGDIGFGDGMMASEHVCHVELPWEGRTFGDSDDEHEEDFYYSGEGGQVSTLLLVWLQFTAPVAADEVIAFHNGQPGPAFRTQRAEVRCICFLQTEPS